MTVSALRDQHCRPLQGVPAMAPDEARGLLPQLAGWQVVDGALQREFRFGDFHRTMAFVNAVAWIAHAEDHHPDLQVGYDRCVLRFVTHSVSGLSLNDFICAAKVDALTA